MRTVALEEHYANPSFLDGPGRELKDQALKFGGPAAKLLEQLCEVGAMRIAEMDAAGIDMQCFRSLLQAPSNSRPRMLRPLREKQTISWPMTQRKDLRLQGSTGSKLKVTRAKRATKRALIVVTMISRMIGTPVFSDRTEFSVITPGQAEKNAGKVQNWIVKVEKAVGT